MEFIVAFDIVICNLRNYLIHICRNETFFSLFFMHQQKDGIQLRLFKIKNSDQLNDENLQISAAFSALWSG